MHLSEDNLTISVNGIHVNTFDRMLNFHHNKLKYVNPITVFFQRNPPNATLTEPNWYNTHPNNSCKQTLHVSLKVMNPTMLCCWPADAVLIDGHRVWTRALAHAVELLHRDVQAHVVVQSFFCDGSGSSAAQLAAVQTQGGPNLLKDQVVGKREAPRHHVLPAAQKVQIFPESCRT